MNISANSHEREVQSFTVSVTWENNFLHIMSPYAYKSNINYKSNDLYTNHAILPTSIPHTDAYGVLDKILIYVTENYLILI